MLCKVIPDKEILWLLERIIDSYRNENGTGVPMGNQTSQLFALYYLDPLDRLIKEKLQIKYYSRYMDDFVLLHEDKDYLKYCLREMTDLVENRLKLCFNEKTQISPIKKGVDYLGFHLYLTETGKVIKKLRTSGKVRMKKRFKKLQRDYAGGSIGLEDIKRSLSGCNGHLKHGHTYKLKANIYSKFSLKRNYKNEEEEIQ